MGILEQWSWPSMPKLDRRLIICGSIICIIVFTLFISRQSDHVGRYLEKIHNAAPTTPSSYKELQSGSITQLHNTTLGFEKVYVINLPSRGDKFDAMTLAASLTGFEFEVINGVDGKIIPDKALSGPFKHGPARNKVVGSWRAHLDLARHIVSHRVSTALVFEDDADWDVDFRRQLVDFALASNHLLKTPASDRTTFRPPHSPYGDEWDLFWLGHCGSGPDTNDPRRFLVKNDPTVTPYSHRFEIGYVDPSMKVDRPDDQPHQRYDSHTRIHFIQTRGLCTYAFALSLRGAQKILYYMSVKLWHGAFDLGLEDMCRDRSRNFTCLSVYPQIVDSHRGAGNVKGDSDLSEGKAEGVRKDKDIFTYNIVTSTRQNVDALMNGVRVGGGDGNNNNDEKGGNDVVKGGGGAQQEKAKEKAKAKAFKSQWEPEEGLIPGEGLVREWVG